MPLHTNTSKQRISRSRSNIQRRRCRLEQLENRHLLAVVFADSFEAGGGTGDWAGNWVEDSQDDWFRSTQRATDGDYSAEVDGSASNATLTLANPLDLSGYDSAQLTFDWLIERGFDNGEYLALDVSSDAGSSWKTDVLRLDGNVDTEQTWHGETVDLTPFLSSNLIVRFRGSVDSGREDANVDNVRITGIPIAPSIGLISHWQAENNALDSEGSNDGTMVSGASYAPGQVGTAFRFDGVDGRVIVPDSPSLALTRSITVEGWIRVDSFPESGKGAILIRGDDRGGLDPFKLQTTSRGNVEFVISSLTETTTVAAPISQGEFVYVAASLDDSTGELALYLNGVLGQQKTTDIRPFGDLDPNSNPGVGIGNHGGYPTTPHNYPFHGLIDDLKLHDVSLSAQEILANFHASKGSLLPSISVSDASVTEGELQWQFSDDFVPMRAGGLARPRGMTLGPDGSLYVSSGDRILRYDGTSGSFIDEFVASGAGGLDGPMDLIFQGGYLYVASYHSDSVLRYDSSTGAFVDEFVTAGLGGLVRPNGLLFGNANDLYVTSGAQVDAVLRYDATTGSFIDQFITPGAGGLDNPKAVEIGPDGNFYVTSQSTATDSVLRYAPDGSFIDTFVAPGSGGLDGAKELLFDDEAGLLYVTGDRSHSIHVFDASTGAFIETVSTAGSGINNPHSVIFDKQGDLLVSSVSTDKIIRFAPGSKAVLEASVTSIWPDVITVDFATVSGTAASESDYQVGSGTLTFAPGETIKPVTVSIVDDIVIEGDETFSVELSNPNGQATISDSEGLVMIRDDDSNYDPIALADSASAETEVEQIIDVLANDSDPDGDPIAVDSVESPTANGGTVVVNPDNTLSYTSAPGFTGSDTFSYTISDGQGGTATAAVTVQVSEASTTAMFVADIDFKSRKGGREWRVEVLVHDENGIALEGVAVTITFAGREYTGTTDASGLARMADDSGNEWRTGLNKNTDYVAEVDSLMKSGYVLEQPILSSEFDHDGDGFYDEILRF